MMEDEGQKCKAEEYPLTVSRTARTSPSAGDQSAGVKEEEEEEDHVISKAPADSVVPPGGAATTHSRCYFESDALALKNNPDYRQLLQTLAVLEAQKMQAIRDIEDLLHAQTRAEKDPPGFVESLKNGTLEPLPRRQQVVELPDIEWKPYIDSLQQVARQHSAIFLNTRHAKPLISSLDEKVVTTAKVASKSSKSQNKPATFGQQWTPEEQAKFEELLKIYPPEAVERRRFQKIAKALGTRTTQQVATHVQKYFLKLANAGLPVPGRMPNVNKYPRKRGRGKRGGLSRPSTFFSTLTPNVLMKPGRPGVSGTATPTSTPTTESDSSDEESELISEHLAAGMEEGVDAERSSHSSSPEVPALIKCLQCSAEVEKGVYWQCTECPQATPTHLCNKCINSEYQSECHSPSHHMQLLSLAPPCTFETTPTSFVDKDYTKFATTQSNTPTGYNYLDPNFYPAS